MAERHVDRRTVLKTLGAGAVATAGIGSASATTALEDELATVREATAKYRDYRQALADGFNPGGPYVPGQGWHWVNPERVGAAAENGPSLEEPQVLTYVDTEPASAEGHLVLGAVEWGIPVGAQGYTEENQPDLFTTEGTDVEEHWHAHHSSQHLFASGDGEQSDPSAMGLGELLQRGRWTEARPDAEVAPGDEVTADWGLTGSESARVVDMAPEPHPDLLTLHAWVYLDNRSHVLAGTNPNTEYVEILPSALMPARNAKQG